jgi:hypothetical protein
MSLDSHMMAGSIPLTSDPRNSTARISLPSPTHNS